MGIVLFPIVIPWGYVLTNCARQPGDRRGSNAASMMMSSKSRVSAERPVA
jgi:hypothetical protein